MNQAPGMPAPPAPLSASDERTWAMLAHLSVLANLVTGFLGPVAAIVIYVVYKDRSQYVGFQAWQAFLFQLVWWVGGGVLAAVFWVATSVLSAFIVGIVCIPIACLITVLPLGAIVYGIIGAVQCNQGQDFRYWLVGDWARSTMPKQA
jgi:uncharacterized Tic20 family protein